MPWNGEEVQSLENTAQGSDIFLVKFVTQSVTHRAAPLMTQQRGPPWGRHRSLSPGLHPQLEAASCPAP